MFSRLRQMISTAGSVAPEGGKKERRATYISFLGEPEFVFHGGEDGEAAIEAYRRDLTPQGAVERGYKLLTNGMSARRMAVPEEARRAGVKARTELMWHVREPTPEMVAGMAWLAQFPFSGNGFIGFGHRVPMAKPPLPDCSFKIFLLLTPIAHADQRLGKALQTGKESVDILTVNLISEMENAFIEREGVDRFLDLLDEREYPLIFDPRRQSYL